MSLKNRTNFHKMKESFGTVICIKNYALVIFLIEALIFLPQLKITAQTLNNFSSFNSPQNKLSNIFSTAGSQNVIKKIGQWGWGPCNTFAVKGNYAFIGDGALLQVLDVSDASAPKAVGQLLTDGPVDKVIVSGNYAYTISPFPIIDITDPICPNLVSTFQLPVFPTYSPTTLTVQGRYAFIGDFNGDIFIVDISNPFDPKSVGKMLASGEMTNTIVVQDTILYVITANGLSIDVFDIANPAAPKRIAQSIFGTEGTALAVKGHYLYLGTSGAPQLRIYDISNPNNQRYVNGINLISFPLSIMIKDTTAFLPINSSDFSVVDIADTNNIHIVAGIHNPYGFLNQYGIGMGAVAEDISLPYVFLPTGTGLRIVDVNQLTSLKSLSFFSKCWRSVNLVIDSLKHAFIVDQYDGLKIIDFSNPSSPMLIGQYNIPEEVSDVKVINDRAYLLCDSDLKVFDISDLESPKLIGKIIFHDTVIGNNINNVGGFLLLDGSIIYAVRESEKLFTVDVSEPTHTKITSINSLKGSPVGISISNNYLYVADADTGIEIFNISKPYVPNENGFLKIVPLRALSITGTKMIVVGWEGTQLGKGGLSIYDISNPLSPILKSILSIPGGISSATISIEGNFAYVSYNQTFLVVDISSFDSFKLIYAQDANYFNISSFGPIATSGGLILIGVTK